MCLNTLESQRIVNNLNSQQLQSRLRSKPRPNRNKPPPQTQNTSLLNSLTNTIHKSIIQLLIGRLIHQLCSDHIRRGDGNSHEETSHECSSERCFNILTSPPSFFGHNSLGNIIHSHLGSIQYACSHNVNFDTTIESTDTLISIQLPNETTKTNTLGISLGECFEYIEGITEDRTKTTS